MALITLLTAEPKKGKTTKALEMLHVSKAVFFVPTHINANPKLAKIPWVFLADMTPERLAKIRETCTHITIVITDKESKRLPEFMTADWFGWAFVFDDFPQLFYTKDASNRFQMFAAGIRHREGQIIVTTQRILGIIPAFVRIVADEIYQVGPLVERKEARCFYDMGGSANYPEFSQFYAAISTNPAYTLFPIKISA